MPRKNREKKKPATLSKREYRLLRDRMNAADAERAELAAKVKADLEELREQRANISTPDDELDEMVAALEEALSLVDGPSANGSTTEALLEILNPATPAAERKRLHAEVNKLIPDVAAEWALLFARKEGRTPPPGKGSRAIH